MPEPLKNLYSFECIEKLAKEIKKEYRKFKSKDFVNLVINEEWEDKELKDRMMHIATCLNQSLPEPFTEAVQILNKVAPKFEGFQYMFFPGFIELYGMDNFECSLKALELFTQTSSSEFAVRPFIKVYRQKMMEQMKLWAKSKNHHVRRLASEGCRPRLPWAMALPEFKKDPREVIKILEVLKKDSSEYVRKSVANNLNDISKDHPDLVIQIAKKWLGKHEQTNWIVKHACRTMLKQGRPEVMALFGLSNPNHLKVTTLKVQKSVRVGESLEFSFNIVSETKQLGKLRLEYAIGFMKKNGALSEKVFKISETVIESKSRQFMKRHSFKKISTRTYYPGKHEVSLIINGVRLIKQSFSLMV